MMTDRKTILRHAAFAAAVPCFFSASAAPVKDNSTTSRPNVIVIFSDDQGWTDLGIRGLRTDIKTPHLDQLARDGILFTDGYVTAPQCSPSRAGLLTGRYQERFGLDSISDLPLPLAEQTIADRLRNAGYVTGMAGKWHLSFAKTVVLKGSETPEEKAEMPFAPGARGFDDFFWGNWYDYWANYSLDGKSLKPEGEAIKTDPKNDKDYFLDVQTDAALAFIRRHADSEKPFFFYLNYLAPHTPLLATKKYLDRFPGNMPERRRTALAMMSAVDDGVGRIIGLLEEKELRENTIIVYISDNGAPLGVTEGSPFTDVMPTWNPAGIWDGSLNEPLRGEKGMLSEGGIRVPFIMSWPAHLPKGLVYREPVISLDVTATINTAAGLPPDSKLDGINLVPYLTDSKVPAPKRDLFWRFWDQTAVRSGDWKLLVAGDYKLLFNLKDDKEETRNVITEHPELAKMLEQKLAAWNGEMQPPGIPRKPLNAPEAKWYPYYFGDAASLLSPAIPRMKSSKEKVTPSESIKAKTDMSRNGDPKDAANWSSGLPIADNPGVIGDGINGTFAAGNVSWFTGVHGKTKAYVTIDGGALTKSDNGRLDIGYDGELTINSGCLSLEKGVLFVAQRSAFHLVGGNLVVGTVAFYRSAPRSTVSGGVLTATRLDLTSDVAGTEIYITGGDISVGRIAFSGAGGGFTFAGGGRLSVGSRLVITGTNAFFDFLPGSTATLSIKGYEQPDYEKLLTKNQLRVEGNNAGAFSDHFEVKDGILSLRTQRE
jgi:arylsulfatase A-like enzyme